MILIIPLIFAIQTKIAISQSQVCHISAGAADLKCYCDSGVCGKPALDYTYELCSLFEGTKNYNPKKYCSGGVSRNEILILDKFCNFASVQCVSVVPAKATFPQFSQNNHSKSFNFVWFRNKNYKSVPDLVFQVMRIEQLFLTNNQIEVIEKRAFGRISGLRSLNVSNNQIQEVELNYLIELEVLDIGRNRLEKVGKSMFVNLTKLKVLALYYNSIESIEKQAFSRNLDLRYLDLGGNRLKYVNFEINLKMLVSFNLNENDIADLASGVFSNLTSLSIFMFERNELVTLDPSQFANLTQLKLLTLDNNILQWIDIAGLTSFLGNLDTLSITENSIVSIESGFSNGSCKRMNKLQTLDLFSNKIKDLGKFSFACFDSLTSLDLSNQMLTNLTSSNLFFGLNNLINLKLNNNSLVYISSNSFIHLTSLIYLDLRSNKLDRLDPDTFQGLGNLAELYLSDNCIIKLTHNVFKSMTKLLKIEILTNKLSFIEPGSFSGFENSLKTLLLNTNRLGFLKNHFFSNLGELLVLDLRDNQISSIQRDTFKDLVKL
jgi:Leucine-rich repeat (LRR) protein